MGLACLDGGIGSVDGQWRGSGGGRKPESLAESLAAIEARGTGHMPDGQGCGDGGEHFLR